MFRFYHCVCWFHPHACAATVTVRSKAAVMLFYVYHCVYRFHPHAKAATVTACSKAAVLLCCCYHSVCWFHPHAQPLPLLSVLRQQSVVCCYHCVCRFHTHLWVANIPIHSKAADMLFCCYICVCLFHPHARRVTVSFLGGDFVLNCYVFCCR